MEVDSEKKVVGLPYISQVRTLILENTNINTSELSAFHNLTYLALNQIGNMTELPDSVCMNNSESLGHLIMIGPYWRTFPKHLGMLRNLKYLLLTPIVRWVEYRSPIDNGVYFECPSPVKVLGWLKQGLPEDIALKITKRCNKSSISSEIRRF
jgi:hypothetical protein